MSDSDIITRCPQCNTAFRVTANQLAVADGVVRCGSCLAVFKAVDYKSKVENKVTSIQHAKEKAVSHERAEHEHNIPAENKPREAKRTPAAARYSEELINDSDDELGLSLEEDIYDLDTSNKNKKTSLFDRTLKPIDEQTRENADESWALDMLSELEDDDIEPIKIKRNPKPPIDEAPAAQTTPDLPTQNRDQISARDIEQLNFDPDITENPKRGKAKRKNRNVKNFGESSFNPITDEEIDSAISSRTNYLSDAKSYISSIEPAPVEMEWLESGHTRRWLWLIAALLISLLLIIQIAVFRMETLSKSSSYRPLYEIACQVFNCKLPDLIDANKIRTTNLLVRSHPSQEGALIIDAILINNAKFQQPYPGLRLQFSDLNNHVIAARILQPKDYLRGELAGAKIMPSNQPIQLSLEIIDPGPSAVNYQLNVVRAKDI